MDFSDYKTKQDITRDRKVEDSGDSKGSYPELQDIQLPNTENILALLINSLNYNIANFYAYTKFRKYISKNSLDQELLQRSMSIHRDFSALCLHTRQELVFVCPELLEKAEKMLFKGEVGTDLIKYTRRLCKVIKDYNLMLYREGYLPDNRMQISIAGI
jgi:hypothetical protein